MAVLALAAPAQAQADITAPSLSSATGIDTTITLTYDEELDTSSIPEGTAFTVTVDGTAVSLSSSSPVAVSGSAVTLSLAAAVGIGKTVTVSYTAPASNPVQDSEGNDAAALTNESVTVSGICDRTPAVRTDILRKVAGVTDCASVTSNDLDSIRKLLLFSTVWGSSLKVNDFAGLSNLTTLELVGNSFITLPVDIFNGLSNLKTLTLDNTCLVTSMGANIFNGLSSLKTLQWRGTSCLVSLSANTFNGLSNLKKLTLFNNVLTSLHADAFNGLSNLETLVLNANGNRCRCLNLDSNIFNNLHSLKTLYLDRNSLDSLDANIFEDLSSLEELHLNHNSLSSLDADIFDGLSSLEELHLNHNSLSSLDADIFDGLSSLEELHLNHNSLSSLDADIFEDLSSLQKLWLHHNSLSSLDADIFDGLSKLKELWLNNNSLRNLDANVFEDLSSLEELHLNHNSLSSLDADIFDGLSKLKELWLNNNSLGSLDANVFEDLSSLQKLWLNQNSLSILPEGVFSSERNLNVLTHLYLGGNGLVCLPRDFPYSKVEDGNLQVDVDLPDCFGVSLFVVSPTVVREGSGGESVTMMAILTARERIKDEDTTVTISVVAGTAEEGTDFEEVSDFSITVDSGRTSQMGTFTLTARADDKFEPPETVTVTGTTALSNSSVPGTEVQDATIKIEDALGVSVSPTNLSVEEGGTATYTVVLTAPPSGTVTVTPSSGDTGAAALSPSRLTFSSSTWNREQTVTVTGVEDDDADDETVAIRHRVSGYGSVTAADNVSVTVTDMSFPMMESNTAGVSVSPTNLSVEEGGTTTYTVVLTALPSGTVTVTPSSGDTGAAALSPSRLTFTSSNWNREQTVTVTGVEDDDADDEAVAIRHRVSGYGSVTAADNVSVTVTDMSFPMMESNTAGVSVSPTNLSVEEGGTTTYTVVLTALPSGTVTVTPSSGDTGAAALSPSRLTFTSSNWNREQTVTVTGVEDDDADDETVAIRHRVSGYGSVTAADNVSVTVTDNDRAGAGVSVSPTSLSVEEGGTTTYTVVLTALPSGTVTVTPSSGDTGAAALSPSRLTFTSSNWNREQTVTVTGVEDDDADDETVAIRHRVSGYGSVTAADNVSVTVTDNDRAGAGVSVSPTSLSVEEGGTTTYTVVLTALPSGTVTVTPSSGDTGAAALSPSRLTFTSSNWNREQTVTVTGVEDDDADDETVAIRHSVSGYGSVTAADNVSVTVTDNDTAGVSVSPTNLSVGEGGTTTYTVVLNTQPSDTVTITLFSDDTGAATLSSPSLTFRSDNWDTAQTVTVTGVEDDDADDETVAIRHSISGYGSLTAADSVSVTVTDNDTVGVGVSSTNLSLTEGETTTYTVMLTTPPDSTVEVIPSCSDTGAATLKPPSLTFGSDDWNTPQTVTVTGVEDPDADHETVTIRHSVSGDGSLTIADNLVARVVDDEAIDEDVTSAWLPRFGRTVAQHVLDAVAQRRQQPLQPGLEVTVAGERLTNAGPLTEQQGIMEKILGFETLSEGQLVAGTDFTFSAPRHQDQEEGEGEGLVFWGRGDLSSFSGQQSDVSVSGEVTTALSGVDWSSRTQWAGAVAAHVWGSGDYEESDSSREGRITSSLTGLFPYGGRSFLHPRLSLWGIVGYGWGEYSLSPDQGASRSANIQMSMAAVGLDGVLLGGGGDGLTVRSSADALLLGISSDEEEGLVGYHGEVSRLRFALEASRPFAVPQSSALLTPSLEVGIRQDGGAAETGFGVDLAAGVLWSDPLPGVDVELRGHALLTHGDESFQEQGVALSLLWDPKPSSSLGPSLSLGQSMGASADSGRDALLAATTWPGLPSSGSAAGQQFEARMSYGVLAFNEGVTITPELGVTASSDRATTSLGISFSPSRLQKGPWEVVLEGERQHGNGAQQPAQHSVDLLFSLLF